MKKSLLFLVAICMFSHLPVANSQWKKMTGLDTNYVSSIVACGDTLFAGTKNGSFPTVTASAGIFRSTNNGSSWNAITSTPELKSTSSLAAIGDTVFASSSRVYRSTDKGLTWVEKGPGKFGLSSFAVIGNTLFGGSTNVYRTTDNGETWTTVSSVFGSEIILAVNDSMLLTGENTFGNGVNYSTDLGATWTHCSNNGLPDQHIYGIGATDKRIFVTAQNGTYYSEDSGKQWVPMNAMYYGNYAFTNNKCFAGGTQLDFSEDGGNSWTFSDGLPIDQTITALFIHDNYLFAGVGGNGIWRRKISELSDVKNNTAVSHSIQNYPNPFASNTTITFTLPKSSEVALSITDALGNELSSIPSKWYEAGEHSISWNASSYPSGVYSCHISADGVSETRKMVVMK